MHFEAGTLSLRSSHSVRANSHQSKSNISPSHGNTLVSGPNLSPSSMAQWPPHTFKDCYTQYQCGKKYRLEYFCSVAVLKTFQDPVLPFHSLYFCKKPTLFCSKYSGFCHWLSALWSNPQSISCTLPTPDKWDFSGPRTPQCEDECSDKCLSKSALFNTFWPADMRNWFHYKWQHASSPAQSP